MEKYRIDGVKYDFERMSDQELKNLHGYLLADHERVTDEIGIVEATLFARSHPQLDLGGTALSGIDELAYQRYTEATEGI